MNIRDIQLVKIHELSKIIISQLQKSSFISFRWVDFEIIRINHFSVED
jgi:hypothetical protein